MTAPRSAPTTFAPATVRTRKMWKGISGSGARRSLTRKPTSNAPEAKSLVSPGALLEARHHDRERGRRDDGAAEPLHRSRHDQHPLGLREPADERGDREERDSDDEHPPPAEQVRGTPGQEEEAAEGDRVGRDDPLEVLPREMERAAD